MHKSEGEGAYISLPLNFDERGKSAKEEMVMSNDVKLRCSRMFRSFSILARYCVKTSAILLYLNASPLYDMTLCFYIYGQRCNFMNSIVDQHSLKYPMVWCGAILLSIHCHQYTQNDNTLTRVWHRAYENDLKTI